MEPLEVALELDADRVERLGQADQVLPGGRVVDPVEGRNLVGDELRGHRLVGGDHELLDDPVGDVALTRPDADRVAVGVQDHVPLGQVEVDRPPAGPRFQEDAHQLRHVPEHRQDRPVLVGVAAWPSRLLQDPAHLVVGHSAVAPDHRRGEPPRPDLAFPVDSRNADSASRGTWGRSEHRPFDRRSGSMGTARSG